MSVTWHPEPVPVHRHDQGVGAPQSHFKLGVVCPGCRTSITARLEGAVSVLIDPTSGAETRRVAAPEAIWAAGELSRRSPVELRDLARRRT